MTKQQLINTDGNAEAASGLRVRDVRVAFGSTVAVDAASFDVAPGEVLVLLGPSGCGKSTLLRSIAGLQTYEKGSVFWNDFAIDSTPVHRRGFGLMFQDGQLFPHRNVAGNVAYGLAGMGLKKAEINRQVKELLEMVGLPGFGDRLIANLSGGERQRVALARALAPKPRLLLLDEPLSALDRDLRERLATDLREVLRKTETTAIFVTHDHDEAFAVADRIAIMSAGKILQIGSPQAVWRTPNSRQVAQFLGYRWFLERRGSVLALHPGSFRVEQFTLGQSGIGLPAELHDCAGPEKGTAENIAFPARVVGEVGAYRDGYLVRMKTKELGDIEVRVPGASPPEPGSECVLNIKPDQAGRIAGQVPDETASSGE